MDDDNFRDEYIDDSLSSDDDFSDIKPSTYKKPETVKEVFGFQSKDENSEENEEFSTDSNLFNLPDTRAWGKKKQNYYATDYVSDDLKALSDKDIQNAAIEEEEAKSIQKRLAKELDDVDFGLSATISVDQIESKINTNHRIKVDISKFTNRQKLQLLEEESPELMMIIKDIKNLLVGVRTELGPLLKHMRRGNHSNNTTLMFVQADFQVILSYCVNILFYLTLKAKRLFINTHPVVSRLLQYRQLLNELSVSKNTISNSSDIISDSCKNLKALSKVKLKKADQEMLIKNMDQEKNSESEFINDEIEKSIAESSIDENEMIVNDKNVNEYGERTDRRLITYQISKNKGLTPRRNKEQRNPRVKHRTKYRKAKIRRKGAIREARKEINRYAGEASGIKIGLKKSIPLK